MKRYLIALSAFFCLTFALSGGCKEPTKKRQKSSKPTVTKSDSDQSASKKAISPAQTVREFLWAMTKMDKSKIDQYAKQVDGMEVLMKSDKPSAKQLEEAKNMIFNSSIVDLKPGDTFRLPDGRTIKISSKMSNENRKTLQLAGFPAPMTVVRESGKWKVDPTPIIMARKAAGR